MTSRTEEWWDYSLRFTSNDRFQRTFFRNDELEQCIAEKFGGALVKEKRIKDYRAVYTWGMRTHFCWP